MELAALSSLLVMGCAVKETDGNGPSPSPGECRMEQAFCAGDFGRCVYVKDPDSSDVYHLFQPNGRPTRSRYGFVGPECAPGPECWECEGQPLCHATDGTPVDDC